MYMSYQPKSYLKGSVLLLDDITGCIVYGLLIFISWNAGGQKSEARVPVQLGTDNDSL